MEFSMLVSIVGLQVVLTNLIVQVLKHATWSKLPTNLLALLVGEAVSIISGIAYFEMSGIVVEWYYIVAFVVLGFMVAYAAMFGFDKFKEIMNGIK